VDKDFNRKQATNLDLGGVQNCRRNFAPRHKGYLRQKNKKKYIYFSFPENDFCIILSDG